MVSANRQRERKWNKKPGNVENQDQNSLILQGKTELMSIPSSCCFLSFFFFSYFPLSETCATHIGIRATMLFIRSCLSYIFVWFGCHILWYITSVFDKNLNFKWALEILHWYEKKIKTFFFSNSIIKFVINSPHFGLCGNLITANEIVAKSMPRCQWNMRETRKKYQGWSGFHHFVARTKWTWSHTQMTFTGQLSILRYYSKMLCFKRAHTHIYRF